MTDEFIPVPQAGQMLNKHRATVFRFCVSHPGFGTRIGKIWAVPKSHVMRALAGESIAEIARSARERAAQG